MSGSAKLRSCQNQLSHKTAADRFRSGNHCGSRVHNRWRSRRSAGISHHHIVDQKNRNRRQTYPLDERLEISIGSKVPLT